MNSIIAASILNELFTFFGGLLGTIFAGCFIWVLVGISMIWGPPDSKEAAKALYIIQAFCITAFLYLFFIT